LPSNFDDPGTDRCPKAVRAVASRDDVRKIDLQSTPALVARPRKRTARRYGGPFYRKGADYLPGDAEVEKLRPKD